MTIKKSAKLLMIFLFSISTIISLYAQDILPGGSLIGTEGYHNWNFVSDDEQYVLLKGTLKHWSISKGLRPVNDWDLCIHVQPASGYNKYLKNTFGNTNPSWVENGPSTIELEVQSLGQKLGDTKDKFENFFSQLFKTDREIEAYGPWVQDWGHEPWNPKTELHPFIYIKQEDGYQTSVFTARDISGRFWGVWDDRISHQIIYFPLPFTRQFFKASGSSSTIKSSVVKITEESVMDISTNERSRFFRMMSRFPNDPKYGIYIDFGEPSSIDRAENGGWVPGVDLGQGYYHPFYLGRVNVEHSMTPTAFVSTIRLTGKTCNEVGLDTSLYNPNSKIIEVAIDMGWENDYANISYFRLSKHNPDMTTNNDDFELKRQVGTDARKASFIRYYNPALGFNDQSWVVLAESSDNRNVFSSNPPKNGEGAKKETILYEEIIIEIPTSTMTVDQVATGIGDVYFGGGNIAEAGFAWHYKCIATEDAVCAYTELTPGAALIDGSLKWYAKGIIRSDGSADPHHVLPIELTANHPWQWEGITLTIDQANPYILTYSLPEGKTKVKVIAKAKTDLGESLSGSMIIPSFGACMFVGGGFEDFLRAIYGGFLLLEKMYGIIRIPRDPLSDPKEISDLIAEIGPIKWPSTQAIFAMPEPNKILPKLKGRTRQALEAFYKMVAKMPISRTEGELLAQFATFGSKIRWSSPPPKGAFEMLKTPFRPYKKKK